MKYVRILLSFVLPLVFFVGVGVGIVAGTSASSANLSWLRFDDPSEHAFSLEVPQGWEVRGGLYRFGYFDVRWMVDVRSADGKVILRVDDASIPPYLPPGPSTPRVGQPYNKPQQFQMMVENYQTGQIFAEKYAQARFNSVCPKLVTQAWDWKPAMPGAFQEMKADTVSEGSVFGTCNGTAGVRSVSVYARTSLFHQPSPGLWVADPVMSAVTAPDSISLAQTVAQHMLNTWQKNPQWEEYQKQMTQAGLQAIQRNFQQFMAQMRQYDEARSNAMNQQVAGFEARQNANHARFESWDETFVGLTKAVDPLTGEEMQIWSGPNANYYRNGVGNVVNSNTNPGGNYHQLDVPSPPK